MDTGEEGFVECFYAVGGEEEDTAIIFNVTETRWNSEMEIRKK